MQAAVEQREVRNAIGELDAGKPGPPLAVGHGSQSEHRLLHPDANVAPVLSDQRSNAFPASGGRQLDLEAPPLLHQIVVSGFPSPASFAKQVAGALGTEFIVRCTLGKRAIVRVAHRQPEV